MQRVVGVEDAKPGESAILRGRGSATREEWEAAREADARDLNRLLEAGGEVNGYVAPLWSNSDVERCLRELRGFDEARVYAELASGEGQEAALAAIAEAEWLGAATASTDPDEIAAFLYTGAGLEIPMLLPGVERAERALALAIGEELTPREIAAVLRGEPSPDPDADSLDHARELLS